MHSLEPSQQMIFKYIFKYNRGWRLLYQQLWDYVASFSVATSNYLPLPWPPANVKGLHSRGRVLCKMSVGKRKGDPVGEWRPNVCGVNYLWFCRAGKLASKSLWSLVLFLFSLCRPRHCVFLSFGSHILSRICKTAFEQSPTVFLTIKKNKYLQRQNTSESNFRCFKKDWLIYTERKRAKQAWLKTYPFSYIFGGCRNKCMLNLCNVSLLFKAYDDIVKDSI